MNVEDIGRVDKQGEAYFFDKIAESRTSKHGFIAIESDLRRGTKYIPKKHEKFPLVDRKMTDMLQGKARDVYIAMVSQKPGARVLEVGCGPGWLALELARNGCHVDAYDVSPKAIAIAKQMLAENPYTDGFGSVTYHLQDVSQVDLGEETYDAASGWSAFHHMPDVPKFMDKVNRALKPGGIVATMDDMPRGKLERLLEHFFEFLLPTYNRSYLEKINLGIRVITGRMNFREESFSPMEAAKHSYGDEILDAFNEKFETTITIQENAFCGTPVMRITGPDWLRYALARFVIGVDRVLCKLGIVSGFERVMVALKKN